MVLLREVRGVTKGKSTGSRPRDARSADWQGEKHVNRRLT